MAGDNASLRRRRGGLGLTSEGRNESVMNPADMNRTPLIVKSPPRPREFYPHAGLQPPRQCRTRYMLGGAGGGTEVVPTLQGGSAVNRPCRRCRRRRPGGGALLRVWPGVVLEVVGHRLIWWRGFMLRFVSGGHGRRRVRRFDGFNIPHFSAQSHIGGESQIPRTGGGRGNFLDVDF